MIKGSNSSAGPRIYSRRFLARPEEIDVPHEFPQQNHVKKVSRTGDKYSVLLLSTPSSMEMHFQRVKRIFDLVLFS